MTFKNWADVREGQIEAVGADVVAARSSQMIARVRAHALADLRRRHGLTQKQVAEIVGRSRDPRLPDRARRPVGSRCAGSVRPRDLGGELALVATFGDVRLKVG